MAEIHEMYGRLAQALENETEAHLRTIALLRELKEGVLDLDDVEVHGRGWSVPKRQKPDLKAVQR